MSLEPKDKQDFLCRLAVITACYRYAAFHASARDRIIRYSVFRGQPYLEVLWDNLEAHVKDYGTLPVKQVIEDILDIREVADTVPERRGYTKILDKIYNTPLDSTYPQIAADILSDYIREAQRAELDRAVRYGDDEKLDAAVAEFQSEVSGSLMDLPDPKNPIRDGINEYLKKTERIPTGISFIDKALDGGVVGGETIGMVMPTKAGKTTMVWQLARECALRGRKMIIFLFEQMVSGDLSLRSAVLCSNSSRDDWRGKNLDTVAQDVRDRYMKGEPLWSANIDMYDTYVEKHLKSVSVLMNIIDRHIDQGKEPFIVAFDWFGAMAKNIQRKSSGSSYDKLMEQEGMIQELTAGTQARGFVSFLFHQVKGAEAGRSDDHVSNAQGAKGMSSFGELLNACFTSSRKAPDGKVTFKLDISRSTDNAITPTFLDGKRCVFTEIVPEYDNVVLSGMDSPPDMPDEEEDEGGTDIYEYAF